MSDLRIRLLGGFEVSVGDRLVAPSAWQRRKARGLVKLLALTPRHTLHREQIFDLLWPDDEPERASRQLRLILHAARAALASANDAETAPVLLHSRDEQIALQPPAGLWIDVEAFEQAAARARQSGQPENYRAALDLYAGELLPEDRYEDWTAGHRERLRDLFLSLLLESARLLEAGGQLADALAALRRVTDLDPAHETAGVALMRAHARSGQRHEALRQYERLRGALRDELDAAPDIETERLYAEILAGSSPSPAVDAPSRPEARGERARHNLPTPLTSFIGREQEIEAARQAFAATRLLTLTGPGGCGKTRLAIAVATGMDDDAHDGVCMVELAALTSAELLPVSIANSLGVTLDPNRDTTEALVAALAARRLLLLLDNCEHLIDACALLTRQLLQGCPTLQILATSREPLGIPGEMVHRVPSLDVPDREQPLPVEMIARFDAVRLFCERTNFVQPDFALTPENAGTVAEITRRLDGIPLAIELAAVRMPVLGVEQLAARLDDAMRILGGAGRTVVPRQQTLRATLDWSHALLDPREQTLFRRLAVFSGGWTIEAAEAVCSGEGIPSSAVLDLLARLLDKSLVTVSAGAFGLRYRLLETVRQYAWERLREVGEADRLQERHAGYYLSLAEAADPEMTGARQREWLARLEREHDNLRAALRWAAEGGRPEVEAQLCALLWRFWYFHGHLIEGERRIAGALARVDDTVPVLVRGRLLQGAGALAMNRGDLARSEGLSRQALALFIEGGDQSRVAATLHNLGLAAEWRGDFREATAHYEESLRLRELQGDPVGAATTLQALGSLAREQRDSVRATGLQERSLALQRQTGNARGIGISLSSLGVIALDEGDYARSATLSAESLELFRELGDTSLSAISLTNLGYAVLHLGDHQRALTLQSECLRLAREAGDMRGLAYGLEGIAAAVALLGGGSQGAELAARLYGAAEALRADQDLPLPVTDAAWNEHSLAAARSTLGTAAFDAAWAAGRALPLDEAATQALAVAESLPAEEPSSTAMLSPLSPREREVATLLALGHTNTQIAATLNMAERTADTHVSNILRKLKLTSRTEVRAWASAHGLLDR